MPRVLGATAVLAVAHLPFYFATWMFSVQPVPGVTMALVIGALWLGSFVEFTAWAGFYVGYHIQSRLGELQLHRAEEQSAARHAALQALRAQVNPHFLFNSLNTLRALIDENPTQAREVVTQLAQLFRAALETDATPLIPLESEWTTVQAYLSIESTRHEARLRVTAAVEPAALSAKVPPFLLQTIVENAVKFGIAPREEGGEVRIDARLTDEGLVVEVSNPGPLVPPPAESTGVGLANARARLRLLFEERAELTLTERDGLVVARIVIPQESP